MKKKEKGKEEKGERGKEKEEKEKGESYFFVNIWQPQPRGLKLWEKKDFSARGGGND